jgi:membrane protease subunit HflC
MRSGLAGVTLAVLALAVMVLGYGSLFTVYQTHQALVVSLGQPVRVVTDPGINFKAPLIDSVIPIDKRILDLEAPVQEVIASDQKRLVVDAFARYRIREPQEKMHAYAARPSLECTSKTGSDHAHFILHAGSACRVFF